MNVKRGISGAVLKWIAIITMTCDHAAKALIARGLFGQLDRAVFSAQTWESLRVLARVMSGAGRMAFPIFAFLLVEGFFHTRDRKRYLIRLLVFAALAEIPFDLALYGRWFYPQHQNTLCTLALGMLMMMALSRFSFRQIQYWLIAAAFLAAGQFLELDYHLAGMTVILAFYLFRDESNWRIIAGILPLLAMENVAVAAAAVPLFLYDGRRGRQSRLFFYIYYPLHLLLLYLGYLYICTLAG